jgi:hypothetical protein
MYESEIRAFKPRTHRIFTVTLCTIGGLILGFFVGQMYSKYQSRNSFYRKLNSIFSGTAKEIASADINPRAKQILRVTALGLAGIGLEVELTNISGKDIEAVQGYLFIFDQFGQELDKLRGNFDKPILAGQAVKYLWLINWEYKGRMRELIRTRLWNDEGQKATVEFATQKVLYSDGTQENFKVEK